MDIIGFIGLIFIFAVCLITAMALALVGKELWKLFKEEFLGG